MKTDIKGCSTTRPGREQIEGFHMGGKSYVQYDYRTLDGELFSCVAETIEDARARRDKWRKELLSIAMILLLCITMVSCVTANPRPWTKAEKGFVVASFVACAADFKTTKDAQKAGAREGNTTLYGDHASDMEMIGYMSLSQLGAITLGHYFPRLRKPILGFSFGLHGGAAIHNDHIKDKYMDRINREMANQ